MTSMNPPAHDCPDCTQGIVLRVCRMCDLRGLREVRGEWQDCTFCAGVGEPRNALLGA